MKHFVDYYNNNWRFGCDDIRPVSYLSQNYKFLYNIFYYFSDGIAIKVVASF